MDYAFISCTIHSLQTTIMDRKNNPPQVDNKSNRMNSEPLHDSKHEQQQTDPQITELKGFVDPKEDLEPTLEDGTISPEKEPPSNLND
jgi:hypothetical protein